MNGWHEFFRRLQYQLPELARRRPLLARVAEWAVAGAGLALLLAIGDRKSTASVVLGAAVVLAVCGAAVGVVSYGWSRHGWPRLKAWLRKPVREKFKTRNVVIAAVAALAVVLWWHSGKWHPMPRGYDTTATVRHLKAAVWVLVASFFIHPGPMMAHRDPYTKQERRVAAGLASLAVVAFVAAGRERRLPRDARPRHRACRRRDILGSRGLCP